MKILHSADWHLDSPLAAREERLRTALARIPSQIADLVRREGCDLVLLAGDIFDGKASAETIDAVHCALGEMSVPVCVSPGNHDFLQPDSPWLSRAWPDNVHIFTGNTLDSLSLPELDCRVYGAGYAGMDCPPLLEGFRAECTERYAIGLVHGDPTAPRSPYCPVTQDHVRESGLDYLALGHIHKSGQFRSGGTLCGWPGCPMGRGFDETGEKGVYLVSLEDSANITFLSLDTPRFYDLTADVGNGPAAALGSLLPPVGSRDYYRISLTGECADLDLGALQSAFPGFPNLELRDRTTPPVDLWATAGDDTLEGVYFGMLREALECADEPQKDRIRLAAKLSRKILDGQEVVLP